MSAARPQIKNDLSAPEAPVGTPSLRILVSDDNRDAAESLAALLRMIGHEVRIAYDGVEAVGLAKEYRPDAVVLDIGMPKMNGYDVARKLRAEPIGKDMTIIALSGWAKEEDKRRSHEAGIDHHLVKPLEPATLLRLLASNTRSQVRFTAP